MNDRSATTTAGGGATSAGSRDRTLTRSRTVTRSSVCSDHASCPYPTSAATTWAAPARSSTSVKPPVDAPASRHRFPATSSPVNAASAPASLWPPRETYRGAGSPASSATVTAASLATWVAGLAATWPLTATRPAAISSAACSRDRARPRLTSSASSLARTVTIAPSGSWPPRPGAGGGCARPRRSWPRLDTGAQLALLAVPAGLAGAHGSALCWPARVAELA